MWAVVGCRDIAGGRRNQITIKMVFFALIHPLFPLILSVRFTHTFDLPQVLPWMPEHNPALKVF